MQTQPTPRVTRADVERVVRRDFAPADVQAALAILDEYGAGSWERERDRVQLAALKLADGHLEALRRHIGVARQDYRDVLAAAEYPTYMARSWPDTALGDEERQRIYEVDWNQYRRWLDPRHPE